MTQRFIEFVMMQAQQAALFLGKIPNPQTGKAEVNLEVARMFIDQLEMIREKTRGNLSNEEAEILTRVLSDLQLAFVQSASPGTDHGAPEEIAAPEDRAPEQPPAAPVSASGTPPEPTPDSEHRKKFTKSYGA